MKTKLLWCAAVVVGSGIAGAAGFVGVKMAQSTTPNPVPVVTPAPSPQKEPVGWAEFKREAKAGLVVLGGGRFEAIVTAVDRIDDAHARIEDAELRASVGLLVTKWSLVRMFAEPSATGRITAKDGFAKMDQFRKEIAPLTAKLDQQKAD